MLNNNKITLYEPHTVLLNIKPYRVFGTPCRRKVLFPLCGSLKNNKRYFNESIYCVILSIIQIYLECFPQVVIEEQSSRRRTAFKEKYYSA